MPMSQAHTALQQKMFQGTARKLGLVGEMVVDRPGQHLAWVVILRPQFKVDGDMEAATRRKSGCPCFDEGLGIGIKVFVQERRRVHRVEQLPELAHAQCQAMNGSGGG
jgi:hypothetical protein